MTWLTPRARFLLAEMRATPDGMVYADASKVTPAEFTRALRGPSEAEIRAAWAHLDDAQLLALRDRVKAEDKLATAALLSQEWCKRCVESISAEELSDPLRHLEPRRHAA